MPPAQVQFVVWQAVGSDSFWQTFTTHEDISRQGKPSVKRIAAHQLPIKAMNNWREVLVESLSAAKTQPEWGRAETTIERS